MFWTAEPNSVVLTPSQFTTSAAFVMPASHVTLTAHFTTPGSLAVRTVPGLPDRRVAEGETVGGGPFARTVGGMVEFALAMAGDRMLLPRTVGAPRIRGWPAVYLAPAPGWFDRTTRLVFTGRRGPPGYG
jgi:hypothetical protein